MSDHDYPDTTTFPRVRDRVPPPSERTRISRAVRGLPNWHICGLLDCCRRVVDLDAVLEIIDGQP
jgi:hypothetical protein